MARVPAGAKPGPMSTAQFHATTLELNRLCLGARGPERPELVPTKLDILDYFRRQRGLSPKRRKR